MNCMLPRESKCPIFSFIFLAQVVFVSSVDVGLTDSQIQTFLDEHNTRRSTVSPPAANMMKMLWNDAIALKAKEVADKLVFSHSSSSFRTYDNGIFNGYHGENLAAGYSTISAVMTGWVNNERTTTNADYSRSNGGHMTQALWHNSYLLGCALARGLPTYDRFWVCQYGYGGNIGSQDVYAQGASCSSCPDGFRTCVDKLCTSATASNPLGPSKTRNASTTTSTASASGSMYTSAPTHPVVLATVWLSCLAMF